MCSLPYSGEYERTTHSSATHMNDAHSSTCVFSHLALHSVELAEGVGETEIEAEAEPEGEVDAPGEIDFVELLDFEIDLVGDLVSEGLFEGVLVSEGDFDKLVDGVFDLD